MLKTQTPRKKKAYATVDNILELFCFLMSRPSGVTVKELKDEFKNISQRTIYRYLQILSTQFMITNERIEGESLWKYIGKQTYTRDPLFTMEEVYGLKIAQKLLMTQFKGTPIEKWIGSLYDKIDRRLDPKQRNILEQFSDCYNVLPFGVKDYSISSKFLPVLIESITWLQRLAIKYKPAGVDSIKSFEIEPYSIVNAKGGLYLIGNLVGQKKIQTFAVERINKVELAGPRHSYDIPEDFKVDKYFKGAFGVIASKPVRIKLKFDGILKEYLRERKWPGFKKFEEKNGSIIMNLEIGITRELISWLLSFGEHLEVLEPPELRIKIIEDLKKTLSRYQ
jgi:proteasome accessory factor B